MCHYPLPCSFSPPLFLFALFPSPLPFHKPVALHLSNKSHLIVHFLSWPGAWCQTSCMKCSFTALPASTFVQRKNNKKSHRASWTLRGFFFPAFWRGGKTALDSLFVLLPCPFKGIQQPSLVVTREDLIFFSWLKKSCFCLAFYGLLLFKKITDSGAEEIFRGAFWSFGVLEFFSCLGFLFHTVSYFWSSANFHFLYWAIKLIPGWALCGIILHAGVFMWTRSYTSH